VRMFVRSGSSLINTEIHNFGRHPGRVVGYSKAGVFTREMSLKPLRRVCLKLTASLNADMARNTLLTVKDTLNVSNGMDAPALTAW
jgi:hypothetical protein